MKTEILERYGIPKEVIKRWQHDSIRQLLPIQIKSLTKYGLLDGRDLIISGPGTSGKTFCGEMAALKTASARGKSIFLVPLKAIAIEKYKTFKRRYSPLGLDIKLSTRDHTAYEKDITKGKYDILISIYEKFNSLTSADISLIKNCGCFVLDEFQMISDTERGIEIELVVSKIRKFNPSAQLVILMGGGFSADKISLWLDIPVLEETRRPVDLRMGVLFRGTFHFRGFNNHDEGDERWLEKREQNDEFPLNSQTVQAIKLLAERGEQTIIFTSTRKGAAGLARFLAIELNLQPAKIAIAGLDELAPSVQNDFLGECLFGGTAFHHAELDQDQRELVESGFKCGEIKILVSTTTLAWGVNLPAKNVFIEGMKYTGCKTANCKNMLVPLSSVDFTQAAGRAGRIGYTDGFGRAVLTAGSPFEHEILWNNYIYGESPEILPGVSETCLPELLARLISCGIIGTARDLRNVIGDTFWARGFDNNKKIFDAVLSALDFLQKGGLVESNATDHLRSTKLGSILSSSGFSARSIIDIHEETEKDTLLHTLEWLYYSLGLPEWRNNSGNYFIKNVSAVDVFKRINVLAGGEIEKSDYLAAGLSPRDDKKTNVRCFELLFVLEWISGRSVRELESCFNRGSGGLRQDALTMSWILTTICKVLEIESNAREEYRDLRRELSRLAAGLKHGLPDEKIALAEALDIDREFVNRLYDMGITGPGDFLNIDYSLLEAILPAGILPGVWEKICNFRKKSPGKTTDSISPIENERLFTGKNKMLSREIRIRGKSVFLQPKLYSYFQKLWWNSKFGNPWIHKDSLEPGINQPKYISKLRRVFKDSKIDVKIISDGAGNYMLLLPESENGPVVAGRD